MDRLSADTAELVVTREIIPNGAKVTQEQPQAATTGRSAMKGPEDDSGLAGKVAIISGGGAAGDGIGNGRAAAMSPSRPSASGWSMPPSSAGAGSTSSTTMSASAVAAASSTRSPKIIGG